MKPIVVSAAAALLLAGCSTAPQGPDRLAELRMEQERVNSYCRDLFRDPALDPLRSRVAMFSAKDTTFEMLTNQSTPNESERLAIVVLAGKKQACGRAWVSWSRHFSPPIPSQVAILHEVGTARLQFLLADLHGGLLTYGQFARKRQEQAAESEAQFERLRQLAAQQSADAAFRAQQLANEARKAAALEEQAANQRRLQQQLQDSASPGSRQPVNCTTNYFGSMARTTCN
jgi:hypothetical protein